MSKQITVNADAKQGMTLAELSHFLRMSVEAGMDMASPVKATVGWRGQLTSVTSIEAEQR